MNIFLACYFFYLVSISAYEATHVIWLIIFLVSLPGSLLCFIGASFLNEFTAVLQNLGTYATIWLMLFSLGVNAIAYFFVIKIIESGTNKFKL